ncbi:MAG: hypothetical protein IJP98_04630 [Clostridia bacterium]|nr:hypothetical protein [Clostridia bacterium]
MLWLLLKKQFTEVFRSYFFDAKKNRMRSKGAIVAWFIFFFAIIVGMLGGMFTVLSVTLSLGLSEVGMNWLYFLLLCGIAIVLGAFGSVFNTFSGLYCAKDNDLLLSLPIPVRTIIASRLLNVYLLGTLYASTVLVPMLAVYWIVNGITFARLICGLLLYCIVTVTVLLLSCGLGWVLAKISVKLKRKSFLTVFIALLGIGAYYFVYFKAQDMIRDLIANAEQYGASIKSGAYALYLFGRIGEGDWLAAAIFTAAAALLTALIWILLSRSFLGIATASGTVDKVRYVERRVKRKGVFAAILGKEFGRFTSSPNYMLNCGLGVLLLPAAGVAFLIMGRTVFEALNGALAVIPGSVTVLLCFALCLLSSMNDMASPSVSLEGKSLWIPQSLPVAAKTVLRAKASVQLLLTCVPMLFASVCVAIVLPVSIPEKLAVLVTPVVYAAFSAIAATAVGVKMPMLNWTNELYPIKQSGAVAIALFGSWLLCAVFGGLYFLVGFLLGAPLYLLVCTVLFGTAALLLLRWLDTKGARIFAAL